MSFRASFAEHQPDQLLVDVVASEARVAAGGKNFKNPFTQFEDGDVERSSAKIVDCNHSLFPLIETVCQRRSRGLINDPENIQTGDASCVLCRLPLRIVEVCGHSNDRI